MIALKTNGTLTKSQWDIWTAPVFPFTCIFMIHLKVDLFLLHFMHRYYVKVVDESMAQFFCGFSFHRGGFLSDLWRILAPWGAGNWQQTRMKRFAV